MDVIENFRRITRARGLEPDHSQLEALGRLQRCYEGWQAYEVHRNPVTRFLVHPAPPKGLYLWGGVGRGKTLLMDCFYAVVPAKKKCRLHFHEFMHDVHRSLEELRGQVDPLDALARQLSSAQELICLDEFHVSDIADAMVLSRLLPVLFDSHVALVATSNFHPDQLYPDGLNRERFLPAIDLLKSRLDIVNVDGGTDYRERSMARVRTYVFPANADAEAELGESFARLAAATEQTPVLQIEQRELRARKRGDGVVWFDFATLCGGPRSQNDYLALAARFHTVILSGVPQMTPDQESAARRFTWLVDILYDHHIKLIMSADVPPEKLYVQGPLAAEFERTVSRIDEMRSVSYLRRAKRLVSAGPTAGIPGVDREHSHHERQA
ncbi:MAG: cell division protein ZapE [Paraburkholderia sp.]|jgi:cell division protein ZapE|uniref:cell division protein ZapE n=1 Tax=unclassified Paraburkholderia TaxID=2615204 RepID=UPI00285B88AA|nr:cell division protein ZapE [Paraburkholderia sp. USG1]MDR8394771.1 cell division protein ZapE [Paraburkholderia sp. USG1]